MVGLDPANLEPFADLARRHEVEVSVIGRFTDKGVMEASFDGRPCAFMDLSFLEEEFPAWEFEAEWLPPGMRLTEPVLGEVEDHRDMLLTMLARPNICSREWITRQYDHEVQGASVLKPLTGRACPVPGDAAVLRPKLTGPRGLCVAPVFEPGLFPNRRLPHGRGDHRRGGAAPGGGGRGPGPPGRGGQLLLAQRRVSPRKKPGRQVQGGATGARLPGPERPVPGLRHAAVCPARTACTWTACWPGASARPTGCRAWPPCFSPRWALFPT